MAEDGGEFGKQMVSIELPIGLWWALSGVLEEKDKGKLTSQF